MPLRIVDAVCGRNPHAPFGSRRNAPHGKTRMGS